MKEYSKYFPRKDSTWSTILLIGRDCVAAQRQEQFTSSQNQHQIIAKTPLGWTVIGSPPPVKIPTRPNVWSRRRHDDRIKARNWNRPARVFLAAVTNVTESDNDQALLGTKQDELKTYSPDEKKFLELTIPFIRQ